MYQLLLHFLNLFLLYNQTKLIQLLHLFLKSLVLEKTHLFILSFLPIQLLLNELFYPFHLTHSFQSQFSSKNEETTLPHEFIFVFIPYFIGVILSKKSYKKQEGEKKDKKGEMDISGLSIEQVIQTFCPLWSHTGKFKQPQFSQILLNLCKQKFSNIVTSISLIKVYFLSNMKLLSDTRGSFSIIIFFFM